jgi:hypothetical protein
VFVYVFARLYVWFFARLLGSLFINLFGGLFVCLCVDNADIAPGVLGYYFRRWVDLEYRFRLKGI